MIIYSKKKKHTDCPMCKWLRGKVTWIGSPPVCEKHSRPYLGPKKHIECTSEKCECEKCKWIRAKVNLIRSRPLSNIPSSRRPIKINRVRWF